MGPRLIKQQTVKRSFYVQFFFSTHNNEKLESEKLIINFHMRYIFPLESEKEGRRKETHSAVGEVNASIYTELYLHIYF